MSMNYFEIKFLDRQETKEHIDLATARDLVNYNWIGLIIKPKVPNQMGFQVIENQDLEEL